MPEVRFLRRQPSPAVPPAVFPPTRMSRIAPQVPPPVTWRVLPAAWLAMAMGCEDPAAIRPGDVRRYTVPKEAAVAPAAASRPAALAVRYAAPPGWTDRGGSGMRLATLAIGTGEEGHEVTVIPASGSLESNVTRWLGQLDPEAPPATLAERAAAALDAAERVEIPGARATIVALFDAAAPEAAGSEGEAILAGVIPVDEQVSLFVKFKGPADVARRERENFTRFVSSIRWN